MCLDGEKNDRMAFQARADYQNHAIGWRRRDTAPLALGLWYDSHEVGWHLGNVGVGVLLVMVGVAVHKPAVTT